MLPPPRLCCLHTPPQCHPSPERVPGPGGTRDSFARGRGGHCCPSWFLAQSGGQPGCPPLHAGTHRSPVRARRSCSFLASSSAMPVPWGGGGGVGVTAWQRTQASGPPPFGPPHQSVTPEEPLRSTTRPHCPPELVAGPRCPDPGTPPHAPPTSPSSGTQASGPPPHRGCGAAAGLGGGQDGVLSSGGLAHLW